MKVHAESFMASLFWLMLAGGAVSSCALTGLRAVAPSNAPPTISGRMQPADDALPHQGIAIDGRGYFGHEILAPADGVVVRIRGDHVTIHHGLDSKKQDIYTEHFHVHDPSPTEGDRVKRGQNIGLIGRGKYTLIPHYHYVVRKREGRGKFIGLDPIDYWFGIDQYKEKLEKGLDIGPFIIPCFDVLLDTHGGEKTTLLIVQQASSLSALLSTQSLSSVALTLALRLLRVVMQMRSQLFCLR